MGKPADITGHKFGRITVIKFDSSRQNGRHWLCKCDCGKETIVAYSKLKSGHTRSCGCLRDDANTKHGHSKGISDSPEYRSWCHMKGRCNNPNDKKYKDYGARGIKVCDRWENSFENFLKDIGKRPSLKYSLDRIDVNGNYEPSNCRWADSVQQARNKRSQTHSVTGVRGVHLHKQMKTKRYQAVIGVNGKDISLGYFETLEEATKARKEAELKYWNKSS